MRLPVYAHQPIAIPAIAVAIPKREPACSHLQVILPRRVRMRPSVYGHCAVSLCRRLSMRMRRRVGMRVVRQGYRQRRL